jgi:enamine deaminase RidA (YjgF/YER057c/UK114 family)
VAAGSSWEKVVKVNVYLKDMEEFSAMNEVYEKVRMEMSSSQRK